MDTEDRQRHSPQWGALARRTKGLYRALAGESMPGPTGPYLGEAEARELFAIFAARLVLDMLDHATAEGDGTYLEQFADAVAADGRIPAEVVPDLCAYLAPLGPIVGELLNAKGDQRVE